MLCIWYSQKTAVHRSVDCCNGPSDLYRIVRTAPPQRSAYHRQGRQQITTFHSRRKLDHPYLWYAGRRDRDSRKGCGSRKQRRNGHLVELAYCNGYKLACMWPLELILSFLISIRSIIHFQHGERKLCTSSHLHCSVCRKPIYGKSGNG